MSVYVPTALLPSAFGDASSIVQLSQNLVVAAENFATTLAGNTFVAPTIQPNFPVVANAPIPGTASLPALQQVAWTVPTLPANFNGSINISGLFPPPFTGIAPTLTFGIAPAPFSGTAPSYSPSASALFTQLQTDLMNALSEGTWTGLPPAVETALWDRAREREYRQQADALAELDRMENLGYSFPPGVFIDSRLKQQTETNYTIAGLSREIAIKQAELMLENITKARELTVELEKVNVQVFVAQIQAFVGQVQAYTAQIEGYKAQAETQGIIEAAFKTSVDAYAAEVNAGAAQVNALVAGLRAQIEAYSAQIEGYKAAISGMIGQAQAAGLFNTSTAEVYKAQIAAITSYNGTLTAQWSAILNEQVQIAQVGVAAAKANGDLYIAARGLSLDASKVSAQVTAQLGAAALGSIHWANTSSWSSSVSGSQSEIESSSV